ncbi:MAG TPA: hypothetical protein IAD33_11950 [Candidatus Scatomorpha gallistercoris]|nr:hypothetical protein [Candidatus Scatomorpha gallistercoris]
MKEVLKGIGNFFKNKYAKVVGVGLVLILLGGIFSSALNTNFGNVEVVQVEFVCDNGATIAGNLYVPSSATSEDPAPAIYVQHGGNSSRESMFTYALEYSRRGYVVFNGEGYGNGYSTWPENDDEKYASYYAIEYLKELDFVDSDRIGAIAHSAGCSQIVSTALYNNNELGIRSVCVTGAGANGVTVDSPFNLAYIVGHRDENNANSRYILSDPSLMEMFGTTETIVEGQYYGSIEDNTARVMWNPEGVFHAQVTQSGKVCQYSIEYFDETLNYDSGVESTNLIFYWRHVADYVALAGLILVMFGLMFAFTGTKKYKANYVAEVSAARLVLNARFYIVVGIIVIVTVAFTQTIYLHGLNTHLIQNLFPVLSLSMVNCNIEYIVVTSVFMILVNMYLKKKTPGFDFKEDAKVWKAPLKKILGNIGIALIIFLIMHTIAYYLQEVFNFTHFHFALFKPELFVLNSQRWLMFFAYFIPFFISQVLTNYVEASSYRIKGGTNKSFFVICLIVNMLAQLLYVLMMIAYRSFDVSLGTGAIAEFLNLVTPRMAFLSTVLGGVIVSPLLAAVTVWGYERSKSIWLGTALNTCLLCWIACGQGINAI